MDTFYILSQIAGTIAFILSLVAYHRKKKKAIFQTMMVANVLDIIHYIFLGAYSGCITKVIALVRNEIIVVKEKNKKYNNYIVLGLLFVAYLISGILTYKNIYSVLPILAAMIYLYFVWNGNELKVKRVAFYCYFLWLAYNICVLSIAGIVSNCVAIISTLIAIINERISKKNKGANMFELIDVYNSKKQKTGKIIERKKGVKFDKEDYIISVTCWVVNSDGKILLTRRKLDKSSGGMWEPTTGLVKSGETSLQAIIRELNEEIGIQVEESEIKLVKEIIENGQECNYFRDIYLIKKNLDINMINFKDGEVIDAKYVTINELEDIINKKESFEYLLYFMDLYNEII